MTKSYDDLNRRCYNAVPDRWLRFPFPDRLPEWIETHLKGTRILEIGPGAGILAEWLQGQGKTVECVEPSEEMARRCKARSLTVVQATFQDYPLQGTFDAVIAICSLVHVPKTEIRAQIGKIASCLPPGKMFFLAMIEGVGEGLEETETDFPRFFARYQKEELLALVEKDFSLLEFGKGTTPCTKRTYLLFALRRC